MFICPLPALCTGRLVIDARDSLKFLDYEAYFRNFLPGSLAAFFGKLQKRVISRLSRMALKKAQLVCAANSSIAGSLPVGRGKVRVVPNGADLDCFQPRPRSLAKGQPLNLVYV